MRNSNGEDMEKIKIGKIVSASGLKGEVKVYNYSDSPDSYMRVASMFIEGHAI